MYIRRYFNQFGQTRRIILAFGEYFIVEFEKIDCVANILAKKNHTLRDKEIKIHAAVDGFVGRKQVGRISSTTCMKRKFDSLTPNAEYPANIMVKLNDDCFKEIFERLSLRDLCAVNGVCRQFRENSQFIFKRKFAQLKIVEEGIAEIVSIVTLRKDRLYFEYFSSMYEIKNVFENFGPLMTSIDLIEVPAPNDIHIQGHIATYCSGEKYLLTKLFYKVLPQVENPDIIQRLQLVFSRLTNLHILQVQSENDDVLLIACRNLIDLNIENSSGNGINNHTFDQIFQSNQQMKRLGTSSITLTGNILRAIGLHLKQLEYLKGDFRCNENEIEDTKTNLIHLRGLSHLKSLKVRYRKNVPVGELINLMVDGNVPIEDLTLYGSEFDVIIFDSLTKLHKIKRLAVALLIERNDSLAEAMKKMKSLRFLHVLNSNGADIKNILQVATTVKELKTFEIYRRNRFVFDENLFRTMVQSVKERGSGVALKINILSGLCELNVPAYLIEANHQWLQIENHVRRNVR